MTREILKLLEEIRYGRLEKFKISPSILFPDPYRSRSEGAVQNIGKKSSILPCFLLFF